jgi:hypothetical protein
MTKRTRLDSRSAREKLKPRGAPYWAEAGAKLDLGYRRIKAGVGSWVMRRYLEEKRTYLATTFAHADDKDEADGVNVLSYHQALVKARSLAQAADEEERLASLGPPLRTRLRIIATNSWLLGESCSSIRRGRDGERY